MHLAAVFVTKYWVCASPALTGTQSSCQILCVLGDLRPKSYLCLHREGRQTLRTTCCRQSRELPVQQSFCNTLNLNLWLSSGARACMPVSYSPQDLRESSYFLGKDETVDGRWSGVDCLHFFTTLRSQLRGVSVKLLFFKNRALLLFLTSKGWLR